MSSGKNVSIGALHQLESTLKVTEIYTCKNKYKIFYKQILGIYWDPPHIMNRYETWTVKKADRKKMDSSETWLLEESSMDTMDHQKDRAH